MHKSKTTIRMENGDSRPEGSTSGNEVDVRSEMNDYTARKADYRGIEVTPLEKVSPPPDKETISYRR